MKWLVFFGNLKPLIIFKVRKQVIIVKQNGPPETYSYSTIIFKFVMFIVIYVLDEIY